MNGLNLFDPQGIRGVPDFWERVRRAPHRLLALDYDGTLAPFRAERALATPLNGVKEILRDIRDQRNTELAILSGRPARQVRDLIGAELRVPIYGVHGWELIHPDGTEDSRPVSHCSPTGSHRPSRWRRRPAMERRWSARAPASPCIHGG